jgi:serine/threonine protein phosphatase PrpC
VRTGRIVGRTDTGRRRVHNEDVFLCDPPLYAVADGMGGAQAGEVASKLAVAALAEHPHGHGPVGEDAVVTLVREANRRIFRRSVEDPAAAGMGTTVTVALVDEDAGTAAIGHVGDSRAYRIRDGVLEQLTTDHSVVAELVRAGRLTEEEALEHPYRSAITRALGTEEEVDVDTFTVLLQPGDTYLLCSDGLTSMMRDEEILGLASAHGDDLDALADALIDAANAAGGDDNITVVLFEIVTGEPVSGDGRSAPGAPVPALVLAAAPVDAAAPESRPTSVRRWGAAAGSRWPALLLIAVVAIAAAILILLGITR